MDHSPRSSSAKKRTLSNRTIAMALVAGFLLVLPSCCIPKLNKANPGAPLPGTFNGTTTTENSAQIGWREFFNDPTLTNMVEQALNGNQELKILTQEVRIANYEILARRGAYLPFLNFRTRSGIEKPSLFTPQGAVEEQLQPIPGVSFPEPLPNFMFAAEVSWEIDIWRMLRNARDASALRFLGTRDGQNYMVTRMVAEVAENYYDLMALDNRMAALDMTIQIQEQSLHMAEAKKVAGRETQLAVQRFQAEVRKNKSEKLIILQDIIEVENKINFTLGRYPQPVGRISANYLNLALPALKVGIPSQLLQYRFDIQQAERELRAAGLDVRVARARFYPAVNLTAGVGYEAFNPRYLFWSPESLIYGVAGDLVAPVVNRAAIKADYMSANAMQLEKVYEYQRIILRAFTEVINRLSKVENYGRSIEIKKRQLEALEASVDSATALFQTARIEYMDVLFAQRDMMEAKMVLIETKQQQLSAIINAYQALGGGGLTPDEINLLSNGCPLPMTPMPPQPEMIPKPEPMPDATPPAFGGAMGNGAAGNGTAPDNELPAPTPELLPPLNPIATPPEDENKP